LLYVYDAEDRQIAPPLEISADNDEAATEQAEKMKKYLMVFAPNCGMVIDWSFGSQAKSSGSFQRQRAAVCHSVTRERRTSAPRYSFGSNQGVA